MWMFCGIVVNVVVVLEKVRIRESDSISFFIMFLIDSFFIGNIYRFVIFIVL